jgi:hypothetical protein
VALANRRENRPPSVLAEVELLGGLAAQRVLHELLAAFRAEIEAHLLVHFVPDLRAADVVDMLEDFVQILETVAVVIRVIDLQGIEGRIDLELDDITKIVFRIERPLTEIT